MTTPAPRRALITGSGGFIGARLQLALSGLKGFDVHAPVRAEVDLTDRDSVHHLIASCRPQTIVHLAASINRDGTWFGPQTQWTDTFIAGRNVVESATQLSVPHLVMAGSLDELGPDLDLSRPAPRSLYGLCKSLVLDVARYAARTNPVAVDWFRPSIVYGPGQRGRMLIPQLLDAMEANRPIDVTDGTQIRDFLFVDDLAQWIVACIQSGPPRSGTVEEHLVATGEPLPVSEVFRLVKEAFPRGVLNVGAAERRPDEPQRVELPRYASDRPVLSAWRPTVDIARGLEETIRSRGRAFEQEIELG